MSQALQRIESDPNTVDGEWRYWACSTAEGRIRTVAMAEAGRAQNNLFWWSREISRPWPLPTDKEGVTSPQTRTRKSERTFSGKDDAEGDSSDHRHEPAGHLASTDGDEPEVEPTAPCINKFLAIRTVYGRGRKKKVITVSHWRQVQHSFYRGPPWRELISTWRYRPASSSNLIQCEC